MKKSMLNVITLALVLINLVLTVLLTFSLVSTNNRTNNLIIIEGHTDNVPINTAEFPDNMMLSQKRAYSVFKYLVNNKGFDPATMMSSGRGESVPIASNSTADGRAQNRRVEIKIYNTYNS